MRAPDIVAFDAPSSERKLAFDLVRKAVPLCPVIIGLAILVRGAAGGISASLAVAIVVANLLAAAISLDWAARRSPAALMATALGGFLARMTVVGVVVAVVRDSAWIDLPTLAVSVLATHLGVLIWESRYVSASLAFPSLKPAAKELR